MPSRRVTIGWVFAALVGFGLGVGVTARRNATHTTAAIPAPSIPRSKPPATVAPTVAPPAKSAKVGTMPEDLLDAIRRRDAGDYIRDSKVPSRRKQRDEHVQRAAHFTMAQRDADYADLFTALGLDDATSVQLRNHLREIIEAKVDASRALGELLDARTQYDNRLKKLLGEKYEVYRADEAAYPARREYELFRDFAGAKGLALTGAERAAIEKLIGSTKAYSQTTENEWGSPYKPVPPPLGGEDVAPFLSARLTQLQAQSAALLVEARAAGLSAETIAGLEAYYRKEIEVQQLQLARVENPDLNRRIMFTRQLDAMKARPDANPRVIQALEAALRALGPAK